MPPTFQQGEIAEQFRDLDLWWEVQSNLGTSYQVVPSVLMTNLTTNVGWRNPCLKMPMTFREFQFSSISLKFNIDIRKWFYFERRSLSINTIYHLPFEARTDSPIRWGTGSKNLVTKVCLNVRFKLQILMFHLSKMFENCSLECKIPKTLVVEHEWTHKILNCRIAFEKKTSNRIISDEFSCFSVFVHTKLYFWISITSLQTFFWSSFHHEEISDPGSSVQRIFGFGTFSRSLGDVDARKKVVGQLVDVKKTDGWGLKKYRCHGRSIVISKNWWLRKEVIVQGVFSWKKMVRCMV